METRKEDDLDGIDPTKLDVGDSLYFINRLSTHIIETKITGFVDRKSPILHSRWGHQHKFTVCPKKNEIKFDTGTAKSRAEYRNWRLWEPQRKALIEKMRGGK